MITLTKILKDTLSEANTERDLAKGAKTEEFLNYIDKQISSYHSNNNVIRVVEEGNDDVVEINFKNLQIRLSNRKSEGFKPIAHDAQFRKNKNKNGQFIIYVYKCDIIKNPLKVSYDKTALKHEIAHYMDAEKNEKGFDKGADTQLKKTSNSSDAQSYFNSPLEVNAYFFEHFMPEVLKFVKKEKEIPVNFDEFRKDLFKNHEISSFFSKLNDKNKKKILKRIGTYYTDILTNKNIKIQNNNQIDNSKLEKSTYGFIKKLKDKLGLFEE